MLCDLVELKCNVSRISFVGVHLISASARFPPDLFKLGLCGLGSNRGYWAAPCGASSIGQEYICETGKLAGCSCLFAENLWILTEFSVRGAVRI